MPETPRFGHAKWNRTPFNASRYTLYDASAAVTVPSLGTANAVVEKRAAAFSGACSAASASAGKIQRFIFTGTLPSGSILEIDSDRYTVKLNGEPVLTGYTGKFPALHPGRNEFFFSGVNEGYRKYLPVTIVYNPKYL